MLWLRGEDRFAHYKYACVCAYIGSKTKRMAEEEMKKKKQNSNKNHP